MSRLIVLVMLIAFGSDVYASHPHKKVRMEDCLVATKAIRAGEFIKVEYLSFTDEGEPVYEIEIRDPEGKEWEFECSAITGRILEIEQEVDSTNDPLFKKHMKVSEEEARKIANAIYPGTIEEVEYEIEFNGMPVYEFVITDKYGVTFKVEVSAVTGEIVEVQMRQWKIGVEGSAKSR